jgi:ribosomal protein S18 acetylase RimI-like enzyme
VSGVRLRAATHDDIEGLLAFDMTVVVRTREDWDAVIDKAASGERLLLVAAHHLDEHPVDHAPSGWYLTGVTVLPPYRRAGLARRLTTARLGWIAERTDEAWYFANAQNAASIRLHDELGFTEVSRAAAIHGVTFADGEGILFRRIPAGGGCSTE